MRRLPSALIDELDLGAAASYEADVWRNQIPREPWCDAVKTHAGDIADWVRARLTAGTTCVPNVVINARKASLGTRPVPILGIGERVMLRALTTHILRNLSIPDRSADAYKQFLHGPIGFAFADGRGAPFWTVGDATLRYVVEADITAFYQYVDHDLLRRELEMHTGEIDAIDALIELLRETEQRTFGLPQLLDASDWLSDLYIQVVERDLLRRGLPVWRYNDDFRIGCRTFTEALDAIERLEEAARSIGLTVSDYKTYTPSFATYFFKTTGREVSDATIPVDPTDVEVIVSDYPNLDEDERVADARSTLARLELPAESPSHLDLRRLGGDDVRVLRRAISTLTRHEDPSALAHASELFVFVPSLTPRLADYLIAAYGPDTNEAVETVVDHLIETASLGEWQAQWIVNVCRELGLLQGNSFRAEWTAQQRDRGRSRPLGAEAALALALVGVADFDDLDQALRTEPAALAPWFLLGMKSMAHFDAHRFGDRMRAVRDSDPLYRVLLAS